MSHGDVFSGKCWWRETNYFISKLPPLRALSSMVNLATLKAFILQNWKFCNDFYLFRGMQAYFHEPKIHHFCCLQNMILLKIFGHELRIYTLILKNIYH